MYGSYLRIKKTLLAAALGLSASVSSAQSFCVFDIFGGQGPFYSVMREHATMAQTWGVSLELKPYTSEEQAEQDFAAGKCDMVAMTGIRARNFNLFSSSIEAVGGLTTESQMKTVIDTLARPEAAKYMVQNGYEVAGILPLGAVYLFLSDRSINSTEKLKGKKFAVLAHDLVQIRMAERLGFEPRAADIDDFSLQFNQHKVDMIAAPALTYMPLELFKGVGNKGIVLKMPLSFLSLQVLFHNDKFPADYGQKARTYFAGLYDTMMKPVRSAEQEILYFYPAPEGEYDNYQNILRDARMSMTAEGIYDSKMISILKKVRCKSTPDKAECTDGKE